MPLMPAALLAAQPPVLRPRDASWWRNPRKELARLASQGLVASPAAGYFVVPPAGRAGDRRWRPTLEGFALALAQREQGIDAVAAMGTSAARLLGAYPRAVAVAVVAVPRQRRALTSEWGVVTFPAREVAKLDLQRVDTDLTAGWVTTAEQTLLDIADRPTLGGLGPVAASEVIVSLASRVDWELIHQLARAQRKRAAYARGRWVADPVLQAGSAAPMPEAAPQSRLADPAGLMPPRPTPPGPFGVRGPVGLSAGRRGSCLVTAAHAPGGP